MQLQRLTESVIVTGGAGRLAYELGLHSASETLGSGLSKLDLEVRQITFWSCFNLDRLVTFILPDPNLTYLSS